MPPATRAASKDLSAPDPKSTFARDLKNRQASAAPDSQEKGKGKAATPPDVIYIEDDSDGENPPPKKRRALSRNAKPSADDIVEISSSSDEGPCLDHELTIRSLRDQLKKHRQENERLKALVARESREKGAKDAQIAQLTADVASIKGTSHHVLPELEEHITCEICVMKMWSPYTLPDCGHTFCQSCLEDWLSSTLAKHVAEHPRYNPNIHIPAHLLHDPRLQAQILALRGPQPGYTCPACRAPVKSRPVEVYALKNVVRTVGRALGESSPRKVLPPRGAGRQGPWDAFFPER